MKLFTIILTLTMFFSCSRKSSKPEPRDESKATSISEEEILLVEEKKEEKSSFLEGAEPFYPTRETLADIQSQVDELKVKVLEYEARLNAPQFNTDMLKKIKNPDLNHEIQMNNGNVLQGSILDQNLDRLIMSTQIGQITLSMADIKDIRELSPLVPFLEFEGDFSEEEVNMALKHDFTPILLGNSRLRTETAGVAGCMVLNEVNYE